MQLANLQQFSRAFNRIVIKIGSALLVDERDLSVQEAWLTSLAEDILRLKQNNPDCEFIIVSSGAIAHGRKSLNWGGRDLKLVEKQAAAAIGQIGLMQRYQQLFSPFNLSLAQILLSPQDTEERKRHLNARNAILQLLDLNHIPIINENDTIATAEIRYGDNDRLAARVAGMVSADLLILLSDVDGLYDADPSKDHNAHHIADIHALTPEILAMGGEATNRLSSGGMITKLEAARIAMQAGCHMVIAKGEGLNPLTRLEQGERRSVFYPQSTPLQARKRWISGMLQPKGKLWIDAGAWAALQAGKSLLPSGVKASEGDFERGDPVAILTQEQNQSVAVGLSAYSAIETMKITGHHSNEIHDILGYSAGATLIHRDDLVFAN